MSTRLYLHISVYTLKCDVDFVAKNPWNILINQIHDNIRSNLY